MAVARGRRPWPSPVAVARGRRPLPIVSARFSGFGPIRPDSVDKRGARGKLSIAGNREGPGSDCNDYNESSGGEGYDDQTTGYRM